MAIGLLSCAIAASWSPGTASAAEHGPRPTEPRADRLAALDCHGDLTGSPRQPVLLIPGTITSPEEAWSWGYRRVLRERGHGVCTVRLPEFGFADTQRSVEYVATAIEEVAQRSGRRLSIVGHSQGGLQALFALRVWPGAARYVEDFVGLAGVYDRGSEWARAQIDPHSRTPDSRPYCTEHCVPSQYQEASGSRILGELSKRELPGGPSYTAIGTYYDETVTPQPEANELPRGYPRRSIQIQDVCPGRRLAQNHGSMPLNHGSMLADAVAHALVLDALDQPGPADAARIDQSVCLELVFGGADPLGFAGAVAGFGPRFAEPQKEVEAEPPLRCNLDPRCEDRRSWAVPLLESARLTQAAILRIHARAPGWLTVRILSGRGVARTLHAIRLPQGTHAVGLAASSCRRRELRTNCRPLRPGTYRVQLETRPASGGYWTRERTLPLQLARR